MEVDLVWKSKWTFMKGLYFFQRYLPFVDTISLVLYRQSDEVSLPSFPHFFVDQLRRGLTKTACAKLYPPAAGS